jgi:hypothetical protein
MLATEPRLLGDETKQLVVADAIADRSSELAAYGIGGGIAPRIRGS